VELHGGHIGCNSKQGQGSEFFFTVDCPLALSALSGSQLSGAPSSAPHSYLPTPKPCSKGPESRAFEFDATPQMLMRKLTTQETGERVAKLPSSSASSTRAAMRTIHVLSARTASDAKHDDAPGDPSVSSQTVTGDASSAATPPRMRVLVAEDHVPTSRLMKLMLTKLHCEVTVVENGKAAVEACRVSVDRCSQAPPFHLIFMDGNMPELGWCFDGAVTMPL